MIKLGRGFKSHPGQSFPLSLCGPISICRANAHMVYGLKHQHFSLHSITTIHSSSIKPLKTSQVRCYIVLQAGTAKEQYDTSCRTAIFDAQATRGARVECANAFAD